MLHGALLKGVIVNVVCLSLVIWKKNNNVESPTSPELRRPSKRVRISVVVRATQMPGIRPATGSSANQSIVTLPSHCRANLKCRWTVIWARLSLSLSVSSCQKALNSFLLVQRSVSPSDLSLPLVAYIMAKARIHSSLCNCQVRLQRTLDNSNTTTVIWHQCIVCFYNVAHLLSLWLSIS